jgi:hypothetical protein
VPDPNRLIMPASCQQHGVVGFTNFAARKVHGVIEFESHAGDGCVISVPELEARRLRAKLDEWL